jgi:hypothetical protein
MKRIKYYLATLLASVLLLSSCSESFFDVNVDPNNPADVTPALALPSGLSGSAYVLGGYYLALGGFWSQHYAQAPAASQWADWETYNLTEDDLNRQFTLLYAGALNDYEYVRKITAPEGNWKYYTIATLMQAYTYEVLADLYDKVPFTEALKGSANLQPKYDNGSVVYDSLIVRINNAIAKDFTSSSVKTPGAEDMIFAGDINKWIQFANTLKLKLYLRYVNVDANKYKTQIVALLNANNFLAEDAKFAAFKAEQTGYNPFYNTFVDRLTGNINANKTLMTYLTDNSDPRRTKIFTASVTGANYNSVSTGESKNLSGKTIKDYATPTVANVAPVYFFSKEEVLFLKAEAQARYGTAADAQATFNAAVAASQTSLGVAAVDLKVYPYNGLESILVQKWIAAANKNSIESFFDYNRTGYPNFLSESLVTTLQPGQRPKRLFFPDAERKTNANTPAKVALTEKVWWGK